MLSQQDNELMTRVGPGTSMGEMLRRYWVPASFSDQIGEPDSAPIRVKLFGEPLVAFRDSKGRVGLLDERCPHRTASLFSSVMNQCPASSSMPRRIAGPISTRLSRRMAAAC